MSKKNTAKKVITVDQKIAKKQGEIAHLVNTKTGLSEKIEDLSNQIKQLKRVRYNSR